MDAIAFGSIEEASMTRKTLQTLPRRWRFEEVTAQISHVGSWHAPMDARWASGQQRCPARGLLIAGSILRSGPRP
jgi:hypothetical protein